MLSNNKRVGLIMMVISVVGSVIAVLFSNCPWPYCDFADDNMLKLVMKGFTITLSEDVAVPTKYFLLFFLGTFGAGLLFYLEALSLPKHMLSGAPKDAE